jgi:hypothetical protein
MGDNRGVSPLSASQHFAGSISFQSPGYRGWYLLRSASLIRGVSSRPIATRTSPIVTMFPV